MDINRLIVITAIIIASLSVGYLKGKSKVIAMLVLGIFISFYAMEYMGQ
ncbi:MAG: hypothetical protein Q4E57_01245 [Eubacteriales bacterium]|nr:hypothetical protein [Eubacteriales bacterium]